MNVVAWIAIGFLLVAVAYLYLVVAGLLTTIRDLRSESDSLTAARPVALGLHEGAPVPAFQGRTPAGAAFSDRDVAGHRFLLLFAHPGCAPCDELVPELLDWAMDTTTLSLLIVTRRAEGEARPEWLGRLSSARAMAGTTVVFEEQDRISRQFGVMLRPYAFVIGESSQVMAHGPVATMLEVMALLDRGESVEVRTIDHSVIE